MPSRNLTLTETFAGAVGSPRATTLTLNVYPAFPIISPTTATVDNTQAATVVVFDFPALVEGETRTYTALSGPTFAFNGAGKLLRGVDSWATAGTATGRIRQSRGNEQTDTTVTITLTAADITAPTITSLATASVNENNAFSRTLTANETVTWSKVPGANAADFTLSGSTLSLPAQDYENLPANNKTKVVTVRATDTAGNTTDQTITVTILDVDDTAPNITSANILTVAENQTLTHTLVSNEVVSWTISGGADANLFTLSDATLTLAPRDYEIPVDSNSDNVYLVQVRATDTAGNTSIQTISVTVTNVDDTAPTITSATILSVPENTTFTLTLTANEPVTWAIIGGTDSSKFTLNNNTLSMIPRDFESPVDADANNIYNVRVAATDTAGNTTTQTLNVTVTDVDETVLTITTATAQSANENQNWSITLSANKTVTWSKDGGTDAGLFNLSGNVLSLTARDYEIPTDANADNVYNIAVRATDSNGSYVSKAINLTILNVDDTAPVITSSASPTVAENTAFSFTLTANEAVTWTKTGGADAALFTLSGAVLGLTARDYEIPTDANGDNVYTVQITATDTAGNSTNQIINLTIGNVDDTAPVITSTSSTSVAENTAFSFALLANETVTWSIVGGADAARFTLSGNTLAMVARDYEAPADADANNVYVVQVRATDTAGNSTTQTINVAVTDVTEVAPDTTPPTITSASSATVNENTAFSRTLTANETVTWSKNGGANAADFTLSGAVLSLAAQDYEALPSGNKTKVVIVRATDTAGNTTDQTITVTIADLDEIAPTITSASTANVLENTAFSLTLSANEAVTWSKIGGTNASEFTLNGAVLALPAQDYEALPSGNKTKIVIVRASDGAGNTTDQTITITITDADEIAPTITSASTASVAENSAFSLSLTANESVTWSKVGGTNAADFTLSGSTLTLPAQDYEALPSGNKTKTVTVRATDTSGNTTDQAITVTITDIDEIAPVITSASAASVAENTAFNLVLTANETVTWTKTGGTNSTDFTLSGSTLSLPAQDYEALPSGNKTKVVTIRATDTAGNSTDQTITITITDVDETVLAITSASASSVAENSAFSFTLTANKTVTWAIIGGADAAQFALSGATLSMTAKDYEAPIDADANNIYLVQVRATDTNSNTVTQTISVTVTDVNETVIPIGALTAWSHGMPSSVAF